jgi:acetoin utilization deacetylase AcuC-like enzyme
MGFCLYNNIAIAAAELRADAVSRVAIVDIDVHHGNGTQSSFYADPTVLYVSSHQYPYYPGTGSLDETGTGAGKGFTLNIPLAAGATDAQFEHAYQSRVVPALDRFRPEAILVSAGFDAHMLDPLAGMRMTTAATRGSSRSSMMPRGASVIDASRSSPKAGTTSKRCASVWRRRSAC